jgi:hypothetical protein
MMALSRRKRKRNSVPHSTKAKNINKSTVWSYKKTLNERKTIRIYDEVRVEIG